MKTPIAIAMLALCGAAQAQSSNVTLYGLVDTGVEYLNQTGPGKQSLVRMPDLTATAPSRFGLRGVEDLGGGLKASFVLESGIAIDSGALNYGGRLFGRQANMSLSNANWTLTLGRQYDMTFHAMIDTDIMGPNIYAVSDLDSYLPNTRTDNAVGMIGRFGPLSFGATYSLGRDAAGPAGPQATNCRGELANDSQACRQWTIMAKYITDTMGASASFDRLNGGPGALFGLTQSGYSDERSSVNGFIKADTIKFGAGILHRKNVSAAGFSSNLSYLGVNYPAGAWSFDGQVSRLNVIASGNDASLVALRATYALSRRTAAYVTAGRITNGGASALAVSPGVSNTAGMAQSGVMLGLRHTF
jgi:predicted porin